MAERVYEGMFLLDANKYSRDPSGVSARVDEMIEKCGGNILVGRMWAEQKLAYQIGNHRKGAYWLTYFRMDSQPVAAFNRSCRLSDSILRNLTLKVEPRLVDALVSHARGEPAAGQAPEEEESNGEAAETVSAASEAKPGDETAAAE